MGWKGEESGLEERMSGLEEGVMDGLEGGKGWVGRE